MYDFVEICMIFVLELFCWELVDFIVFIEDFEKIELFVLYIDDFIKFFCDFDFDDLREFIDVCIIFVCFGFLFLL